MQVMKMLCLQCPEYEACPQRTRLFINYCGSRKENVEKHIHEATVDCVARRGFVVKNKIPYMGPMLVRNHA